MLLAPLGLKGHSPCSLITPNGGSLITFAGGIISTASGYGFCHTCALEDITVNVGAARAKVLSVSYDTVRFIVPRKVRIRPRFFYLYAIEVGDKSVSTQQMKKQNYLTPNISSFPADGSYFTTFT